MRKFLALIVALFIAAGLFWWARNRMRNSTEPMEGAPTASERQELKDLLPPNPETTPQKKKP